MNPLSVVSVVALMTPLLVTLVVCVVAHREGTALPTGALIRLVIATAAAVVLTRFVTYPGLLMLAATAILFCFFAIPVTTALERNVLQRLPDEPVREASLVARNVRSYLPLSARAALIVSALGILSWVVTRILATRPTVLTIGCTLAGVTFFALYECWIREEVFSVRAKSEADRTQRIRAIFAAQTILTISLLIVAGLSTTAWPGLLPLSVFAGITGAIGCAFALSTGIQERYLQAWNRT